MKNWIVTCAFTVSAILAVQCSAGVYSGQPGACKPVAAVAPAPMPQACAPAATTPLFIPAPPVSTVAPKACEPVGSVACELATATEKDVAYAAIKARKQRLKTLITEAIHKMDAKVEARCAKREAKLAAKATLPTAFCLPPTSATPGACSPVGCH